MSTEVTVKVAPLVRDGNYKTWASSMRALLGSQKRQDKLLDSGPDGNAELEERDVLCKAKLQLHVSGPLKAVVDRSSTAKDAWDALNQEYVGSLQVRQPMLMAALTDLSQGADTIVQYIDKAKAMRDDFEDLANHYKNGLCS